MNVAVVGRSGQAGKYIGLVQSSSDTFLSCVYYPKPTSNTGGLPITDRFADLLDADAVVIASPTYHHAEQLEGLADYQGYVLLEKPAVSTVEETRRLRRFSAARKARIRVNYNLWHSALRELIQEFAESDSFGELISLNVFTGHGFAFQEKYMNNWRSDPGRAFGVLELVGVHFIHLALKLFGPLDVKESHLQWHASSNGPPDSVDLLLSCAGGGAVKLFHSYTCPFLNRMLIIGTNGYVDYDGHTIQFYTPRDTFDEHGRFSAPPVTRRESLGFAQMWRTSLEASFAGFLSVVRAGSDFPTEDFDAALDAMDPVFHVRSRDVG